MSGRKTVSIASSLTRRQAMVGGTAALVSAPFVIRSGFAQRAAVNIGVIQPLSGANAQFGINSRNGIELVADEINAAGGIKALGGAKINLVVSDATSNPTTASTVARRLITQNELAAILGAFASSLTLAISEVTARADIPFLTQAFADEITGRGLESVFQLTPKASVTGRAQVNYTLAIAEAAGSKIEKIAIMYEDTAYGTAQSRGLRRAAKDANIEVVMDEAYPLGITDATPLIEKLHASRAQAVFPLSYLNDSLFIIRAMRQQRVTVPAPRVDGPVPQALRLLHGARSDRIRCCSPRARAGDRASEVGKAESGDRSPARRALRSWLDQSDARRRGSIRSGRPQHAFGTDHGSVAQQGAGDGLAERHRQSFPGVALLNADRAPCAARDCRQPAKSFLRPSWRRASSPLALLALCTPNPIRAARSR